MAKKKPDELDDELLDDAIDEEEMDADDDIEDDDDYVEATPEVVDEEVVLPPPEPVKVQSPEMFEHLIALLQQAGLQMPPHTTADNIIEQLVTALTVAVSMGARFERDKDDASSQPPAQQTSDEAPLQTEAPPMTMMSTVAKLSDAKLAKYGLQRISASGVTMLSTDSFSDRERVWAEEKVKDVRREVAKRWKYAVNKLGLFPDFAEEYTAGLNQMQLSFLPNGAYLPHPDLRLITAITRLLKRQQGVPDAHIPNLTRTTAADPTTLSTSAPSVVPNPTRVKPPSRNSEDDEPMEAKVSRFLKNHYGEKSAPAKLS